MLVEKERYVVVVETVEKVEMIWMLVIQARMELPH